MLAEFGTPYNQQWDPRYQAARTAQLQQMAIKTKLNAFQNAYPSAYDTWLKISQFLAGQYTTPPVDQAHINELLSQASDIQNITGNYTATTVSAINNLINQYLIAIAPFAVQQQQADIQAALSAQNDLLNSIAAKQADIDLLNGQMADAMSQLATLTSELTDVQTAIQTQAAAQPVQSAQIISPSVGPSPSDITLAPPTSSAPISYITSSGGGPVVSPAEVMASDLNQQSTDLSNQLSDVQQYSASLDPFMTDMATQTNLLNSELSTTNQIDANSSQITSYDQQYNDQMAYLDQLRNELSSAPSYTPSSTSSNQFAPTSVINETYNQSLQMQTPQDYSQQNQSQLIYVEDDQNGNPIYADSMNNYYDQNGYPLDQSGLIQTSTDQSQQPQLTEAGTDDNGNPVYVDQYQNYYDQNGNSISSEQSSVAYSGFGEFEKINNMQRVPGIEFSKIPSAMYEPVMEYIHGPKNNYVGPLLPIYDRLHMVKPPYNPADLFGEEQSHNNPQYIPSSVPSRFMDSGAYPVRMDYDLCNAIPIRSSFGQTKTNEYFLNVTIKNLQNAENTFKFLVGQYQKYMLYNVRFPGMMNLQLKLSDVRNGLNNLNNALIKIQKMKITSSYAEDYNKVFYIHSILDDLLHDIKLLDAQLKSIGI